MTGEEKDDLLEQYAVGTCVVFRDANATVSDSADGLREGTVIGSIWFADDEEFDGAYTGNHPVVLPVWAERDQGREPTTILVAWENVVGVKTNNNKEDK